MNLLAQALNIEGESGTTTLNGPVTAFTNLGGIVSGAMTYIFFAAGAGVLLMLISAGFSMLTSAGDSKKMEGAKQRITNSIVGFILIFAAYWLVQIIGKILGIDIIESTFPLGN